MYDTTARAMLLGILVLGGVGAATAQTRSAAPAQRPEAAEAKDPPAATSRGGIAAEGPEGRGRGCVPPPPEGPAPRPPDGGPAPEAPEQAASRAQTTIDRAAHARAVKKHAEFLPAAAAPTGEPARRTTLQVPSRSGAQAASLTVAAGEIIRFEARSGKWTVDERTIPPCGPDGHLESLALHKDWGDRREVGSLPFGRLLARVGRGPWIDAGSGTAVRFLDSGELRLRINDNDGSLADNAGALEIEVQVHPPSKP